ncbi:DUF938 domain-containing protein [Gymnodinialimonas sp. 57CJ19]|uniref:DUF938 domain-containing protein n=1 Tax=Gymnodinialimonas sp. 57CJ19 TaxID=3138498 RepID=UPI0031345357
MTEEQSPTYTDGRLSAPYALRNRDAITDALRQLAPPTGRALEIASGTGQHVVGFAKALPGLHWQPSDPDETRRASIEAWTRAEQSTNIAPPMALDASEPGWSQQHGPFDLIFLANLLHLIPDAAAATCLSEMANALRPGGRVVVYGPFLRDGKTTSDGDAEFDARIRSENPGAGYKDVRWVLDAWTNAGLSPDTPQDMPANNLLLSAIDPNQGDLT